MIIHISLNKSSLNKILLKLLIYLFLKNLMVVVYLWSLHMNWVKSFVKLWDLQKSLTSLELFHPDAFNHRQQVKKHPCEKPTNQKVMTAGKVESCKIFIITFEVIMLLINGKNSSSNKWQFQLVFNLAILLSFVGLFCALPHVSLLWSS